MSEQLPHGRDNGVKRLTFQGHCLLTADTYMVEMKRQRPPASFNSHGMKRVAKECRAARTVAKVMAPHVQSNPHAAPMKGTGFCPTPRKNVGKQPSSVGKTGPQAGRVAGNTMTGRKQKEHLADFDTWSMLK